MPDRSVWQEAAELPFEIKNANHAAIDISCPFKHFWKMTIALAKDVEDFLQEQIRTGACNDASDLVNELLRSVRNQQLRPFTVTPELEAWLLDAADNPDTPLTEADFRGIRERVGARFRSSAA